MDLKRSVFDAVAALAEGASLPATAARWRVLVMLLCSLTAWMVWGALAHQSAQRQQAVAAQQLLQVQRVRPESALAAPAPTDFAAQLSAAPPTQRIVEVLQRAAQQSSAQLDAVRVQEQAATPNRLARTDVSIELKAPYAAAKAVLGESMARLPSASMTRMQWRVDPGGALVQFSANVSVWGAPLQSTAASAPR